MKEYQIFISYNSEDIEFARRLHRDLKNFGMKPWLDKEDIKPGQEWDKVIADEIRNSRYFLALLSSRMVSKRGFVHKEIKTAEIQSTEYPEGQIFIIPVRLDECKPPYSFLRGFQWVDMFPNWEEGVHKLLRAMAIENARQIPRQIRRVSVVVCDFRNFSKSARDEFIGERYSEHVLHKLTNLVYGSIDLIGSDLSPIYTEHRQEKKTEELRNSAKNLYEVFFGRPQRYSLLISGDATSTERLTRSDLSVDDPHLILRDRFGIYISIFEERLPFGLKTARPLLFSQYMWSRYDAFFLLAGSVEEPTLSKYRSIVRLLWITEFDERTLAFKETEFDLSTMIESARNLSGMIHAEIQKQLNLLKTN